MNKTSNQTNKNRDAKTLILIFFCIFVLAFVSYRRMRDFREALPEIEIPEFEIPEIKIPDLDEFEMPGFEIPGMEQIFPQRKGEQEFIKFISPDQRLTFKYPFAWMRLEEKILKYGDEEMIPEGVEILFFAQGMNIERMASISLFALKIDMGEKATFENVIEKIKKDAYEREIEIEIIELKEIEPEKTQIRERGEAERSVLDETKFHRLKIRHKHKEELSYISRKKIILTENQAYLIALIVLEDHLPVFEREIEKILDSVQLIL